MPKSMRGPTRPEVEADPVGGALGGPVLPGEFVMRLLDSMVRSQAYLPGDPDLAAMLESNAPSLYRTYYELVEKMVRALEAKPPGFNPPDDATEVTVTVSPGAPDEI